jgi:tetratricopeptide (TPR) repeat protein
VRLSELLPELGEYAAAHETAVRAIEAADAVGDRPSALRAGLVRILNRSSIDPTHTMAMGRRAIEEVLDQAERLGDADLRDRAILAKTLISFFQGKTSDAMAMIGELSDRVPTMSRRDRGEIAGQMAICTYFGSVPVDDAFAVLDRTVRLRGESLIGEADDLRIRCGLFAMAGRFDEAHEAAARSRAIYEELGAPTIMITTSQITAELLRLEGRSQEAERVLRGMHELYESTGETAFNSTICSLLGHALCDQGRFDEAKGYAARSRELASEDDFASQGDWRLVQARVLSERSSFEEALGLAEEAVAIMDATDYLDWQGRGHEVRADVLKAAGRGNDARGAYETALARYERKGNVVAAARVRARMP